MRSRLTPAVVIVASALVTASIIVGQLVLLAKWDNQASSFGMPQVSTATMPDGSVLTLHSVSFGKSHTMGVPIFGVAAAEPSRSCALVLDDSQ
jgi:hypothetical protein